MARLKNRTTTRYFEKGKYVKDGLYCWTKGGADFECKVECPYNERKAECDCHTAVSKDALEYINELETKLADVVPKSEVIDEILSLIDDKIRYEVEIANSFISARHHKTLYQERINALNDMKLIINYQYRSELKKKYTEGKT